MKTVISSATKQITIGEGLPTALIGERINPAGKKAMQEALMKGDMDAIRREALAQVGAGADIIDVNVTMFGIDEVEMLPKVVKVVSEAVDMPLCIDSANHDAVEAALKACPGKPLINSVTGEEKSLDRVLPLVKEYGVSVVGLVQDDAGLPHEVEKRVAVAHKIVERAAKLGIPPEQIVIDCLCFAVGAEPSSGRVTLETIRRVRAELGVNMTLGASNVSFGMPDRGLINNAFVALAIAAGATSLIVDAAKVRPAVLAADLLLENDKHARRYIADFRKRQQAAPPKA